MVPQLTWACTKKPDCLEFVGSSSALKKCSHMCMRNEAVSVLSHDDWTFRKVWKSFTMTSLHLNINTLFLIFEVYEVELLIGIVQTLLRIALWSVI